MSKNGVLGVLRKRLKFTDTVLTYVGVAMLSRFTALDKVYFNSEIIAAYTHQKDCSASLLQLCKEGVISKETETMYSIESTPLTEPFFTVHYEDLELIWNSNCRNKNDLVIFYLRLIASFNFQKNDGKIGYMNYAFFMSEYNMSKSSVRRYFDQLVELKVIVKGDYNEATGNAYVRYCDAHLLKVFSSNDLRRISAKYNAFIKNPDSFTKEELKKLYDDCLLYNQCNKTSPKLLDKIKSAMYNVT